MSAANSPAKRRTFATGRPTKFRPELGQRIVDVVRITGMMESAAAAAGVHRATLYRWLERGAEQRSGELKDFCDAVTKAQGESETRLLSLIMKSAANGDWRAASWLLEKRNPQTYGPRVQLTMQQAFDQIVEKVATEAPHLTEQLLTVLADEVPPSTQHHSAVVLLPPEPRRERPAKAFVVDAGGGQK